MMEEETTASGALIERRILLAKLYAPLGVLSIGRDFGDEYCLQFNEFGYDKTYRYYDEHEVLSRLSGTLSDEALLELTRRHPDAVTGYWSFYGQHYTFEAGQKELQLASRWPSFQARMEEVYQRHHRSAWAVLKAYTEVREDHHPWSSCDYNRLQYRARQLGGKTWKNALIALEIAGIVQKRGTARRPGERSIALELMPLVEHVLREWGERLDDKGEVRAKMGQPIMRSSRGIEVRRGILAYLLEREHSGEARLPELKDIAQGLGVGETEVDDQLDILESLGAIRANRTFGGGVAPILTGAGKILLEELTEDTSSEPAAPSRQQPRRAVRSRARGTQYAWDVFISHASEDKEPVRSKAGRRA